jgi:ABC-type multidrug transport system fused ATPase/permease subunit
MFVLPMVGTILAAHSNIVLAHAGVQFRNALIDIIYRKSLKLSPASRQKSSTGQIVNMFSNDTAQMQRFLFFLNNMILAPPVIAVCLFLIICRWADYCGHPDECGDLRVAGRSTQSQGGVTQYNQSRISTQRILQFLESVELTPYIDKSLLSDATDSDDSGAADTNTSDSSALFSALSASPLQKCLQHHYPCCYQC